MDYTIVALEEVDIADYGVVVIVLLKLLMKRLPVTKVTPSKVGRMDEYLALGHFEEKSSQLYIFDDNLQSFFK